MKYKFLIPIALSVVVGLFFGKVFFDNYDSNAITVFDEKNKVYMLQVGVYSSKDKMSKSIGNYKDYLYISTDDGYHLYVGITKDKENASKIKNYYEENGYSIYVKESIVDSKEFIAILNEYDKIVKITSKNDIKDIEKIVIANYKEMVLENEN